jgi:hypothetical protein
MVGFQMAKLALQHTKLVIRHHRLRHLGEETHQCLQEAEALCFSGTGWQNP